jgi:hypothetical protein
MKFLSNLPIRRKVMLVMMLTAGVALLLACIALLSYESRAYRAKLERDLSTLAKIIGATTAPPMSFNYEKEAGEYLEALKAEPQILAARLFRADRSPFVGYTRPGHESDLPAMAESDGFHGSGDRLTHVSALYDEEEKTRTGTVVLVADYSGIRERLKSYAGLLAVFLFTSGLVALVLSA